MGGEDAAATATGVNVVDASVDAIDDAAGDDEEAPGDDDDDEEVPEDEEEEEFMYLRNILDGLFRREQTHLGDGEGDEPFVENP